MATIASMIIAGRIDPTDFNRGITAMVNGVERFAGRVRAVGRTLTTFLTLPVLAAGAATIKMASDAGESSSKLEAVFRDATAGVNRSIESLRATIPATTAELQDFTSDIFSLLSPMGIAPQKAQEMSLAFVQLAGDIASFRNENIKDVMIALRSGLVGETEPVRRFGVSLNQARVEAVALAQGLWNGKGTIDAGAKAAAAFNIILHDTALAHQDAARTAGSAANQFKFFSSGVRELATLVGKELLPIITPIVTAFNVWLRQLRETSPETIRMGIAIAALVAFMGPLIFILGSVVGAGAQLFLAFSSLGALLTGPVGLAIIGAIALFVALRNNVFGVSDAVDRSRGSLQSALPSMRSMTTVLSDLARVAAVVAAIFIGRLVGSIAASVVALYAKVIALRTTLAAEIQSTAATLAAARANVAQTAAVVASLRARIALLQVMTPSVAVTSALAATTAALATAEAGEAAAATAASAAEAAHTAALAAMSVGARAAAISVGFLNAALSFFGGPIGLAITIVLGAIALAFVNAGAKARQAALDARGAATDFANALRIMDTATVQAKLLTNTSALAELNREIAKREADLAAKAGRGPLVTPVSVGRGGTINRLTPLGQEVQTIREDLKELEAVRVRVQAERKAIGEEIAARNTQVQTLPPLEIPDVPTGPIEKAKSAADQLRDSVQNVATRLEFVRERGEDATEPLRAAIALHAEITRRIEQQGGVLKANTELLEAASLLSKAISDNAAIRDKASDLTQRLEIAYATGQGVAEAVLAAQTAYTQVNAEIERQGGILKANVDTLQAAYTIQQAIARQTTVVATRATTMIQRFQAIQSLGTEAWTGMLGQITTLRDEIQTAIDAQGGVLTASAELVAAVGQLNGAISQIQVKVERPTVRVDVVDPAAVTLSRIMDDLSERSERLGADLDEALLGFTRLGVGVEAAYLRLRVLVDVVDAIRSVSPATLFATVTRASYEVSRSLLGIVNPMSIVGGVFERMSHAGLDLLDAMNPLNIVFDAIGEGLRKGLGDSLDRLGPLIEQVAALFGQVLAPVVDALAPIVAELAPVIAAVAKVFAALFIAITPILRALIPLLAALFPVFKVVAIAATYIGQIFFTVAGAILKVVSFFVNALGSVIRAIGKVINAITPFGNPGNPLVRAGETLQGVARGMGKVADGFFEAVGELGRARDEIRQIEIGDALDPLGKLGDAAGQAADALFNVPNAYRLLNLRKWQSQDAWTGTPATTVASGSSAMYSPTPASTTSSTSATAQHATSAPNVQHVQNNVFNMNFTTKEQSAREVASVVLGELKTRARAQFGDEQRWSEVQ